MAMPFAMPRYTVDDLESFPNDGQRYELLDGALLVSPAPARRHQAIVNRLVFRLNAALLPGHIAEVAGPGRLLNGSATSLEPDILVYPPVLSRTADWADINAWWLAVEVLSPSTRMYDTDWKRRAYQALGIHTTWLVDPDDERVSVWEGTNPVCQVFSHRLRWVPPAHPGPPVEIDLTEIFD